MDRYRGSQIGAIIQCEKGHVLTPNYTSAIAYDKDGNEIQRWQSRNELAAHFANWLTCIASRDASKLNQPIESGHVSSALCYLGGISHQIGKPATAAAIREQIKGKELFAESFERMAAHLRANEVDIDSGSGALTLGAMLEIDPKTEMFVKNDEANALRGRVKQRAGFEVPDIERGLATAAAAG
jgi:hypothetical protein